MAHGNVSRSLLILACSQLKFATSGLMPAIERYDGVNYRVLKKAKRVGNWPSNLDILILSAKYGLIAAEAQIEYYDLRLTPERAVVLREQISNKLDYYLRLTDYSQIFINLGKVYLSTLTSSKKLPEYGERVIFAKGGIGKKMSQMKAWLVDLSQQK